MSTATFAEFAERADYSLLEALTPDPESTVDGEDPVSYTHLTLPTKA